MVCRLFKIESLLTVSAVITIDLEGKNIILDLHECTSTKNRQIYLLSTFQAREAGVMINYIARRHNDKQNVEYYGHEIQL